MAKATVWVNGEKLEREFGFVGEAIQWMRGYIRAERFEVTVNGIPFPCE